MSSMRPVVALCAAMLLLCVLTGFGEATWVVLARRSPWRWSPLPGSLRRSLVALCGAALALGSPAGAHADHDDPAGRNGLVAVSPSRGSSQACSTWACEPSLAGLRLPDLPDGAALADLEQTWLVRRGDCLWSIAAQLVGPSAASAEIARLVDALYALNRGRIGADPDLIFPGTRLTIPEVVR